MEKIKYNKDTGLIILPKNKEYQIGLYDFHLERLLAYCRIKRNGKSYEILNLDSKDGYELFIKQAAQMTVYPFGIIESGETPGMDYIVNYCKADNDYLELIKRGVDLITIYEVNPIECIKNGYNKLLDKLRFSN